GQRPAFLLEARQALGITCGSGGKDLDGHVALQPRVPRAIDLAHASGAQRGQQLVGSKAFSGVKGHPSGLWNSPGGFATAETVEIRSMPATSEYPVGDLLPRWRVLPEAQGVEGLVNHRGFGGCRVPDRDVPEAGAADEHGTAPRAGVGQQG